MNSNVELLKYIMDLAVNITQTNLKKGKKIKIKEIGENYRNLLKEFNIQFTNIEPEHIEDCDCLACQEERQMSDQEMLIYDVEEDSDDEDDEDDENDEDDDEE